jgi:hypothetical protein
LNEIQSVLLVKHHVPIILGQAPVGYRVAAL